MLGKVWWCGVGAAVVGAAIALVTMALRGADAESIHWQVNGALNWWWWFPSILLTVPLFLTARHCSSCAAWVLFLGVAIPQWVMWAEASARWPGNDTDLSMGVFTFPVALALTLMFAVAISAGRRRRPVSRET